MTAIEQSQLLRNQAVQILLAEQGRINEQLALLGHGDKKATLVKRGRPKKITAPDETSPLDNSL